MQRRDDQIVYGTPGGVGTFVAVGFGPCGSSFVGDVIPNVFNPGGWGVTCNLVATSIDGATVR